MDDMADLGEFLRSRRAAIQPEDVGLTRYNERRQVTGLRPEELAQLAGLSVTYYTRLEQGHGAHPSESVVESLAQALRLRPDETTHLRALASPRRPSRRRARPEKVRPGVSLIFDSYTNGAAFVIGRHTDILAANDLGWAMLGQDAEDGDSFNLARFVVLDPRARDLYADWNGMLRNVVGYLRYATGQYPDDQDLFELIGELCATSGPFATAWARHHVRNCASAVRTYTYNHPEVGPLTLTEESLELPEDKGQRLVLKTAEPGSPSAERLRLLASLHAPLPVSTASETGSTKQP
jgi:transcriptional regulator with XRE-family HTH domain